MTNPLPKTPKMPRSKRLSMKKGVKFNAREKGMINDFAQNVKMSEMKEALTEAGIAGFQCPETSIQLTKGWGPIKFGYQQVGQKKKSLMQSKFKKRWVRITFGEYVHSTHIKLLYIFTVILF